MTSKIKSKFTGKTTNQIKHAPPGCIYVCPSDPFPFVVMANTLNRTDITFVWPSYLQNVNKISRLRDIVIDHACEELYHHEIRTMYSKINVILYCDLKLEDNIHPYSITVADLIT